jgi:hypothetical protein
MNSKFYNNFEVLSVNTIIKNNREICSEAYQLTSAHLSLDNYDKKVLQFIESLTSYNESIFLSFLQPEVLRYLPQSSLFIFHKFKDEIKQKKVQFFDYSHRKTKVDYLSIPTIFEILKLYPQLLKSEDLLKSNYYNVYFKELLILKKSEIFQIKENLSYQEIVASKILPIIHTENGIEIFYHINNFNCFLFNAKFYSDLILRNCYGGDNIEPTFILIDSLIKKDNRIDNLMEDILHNVWVSYLRLDTRREFISNEKKLVQSKMEKFIFYAFENAPHLDLEKNKFLTIFLKDSRHAEQDELLINLSKKMNKFQKKSLINSIHALDDNKKTLFDKHLSVIHIIVEQDYFEDLLSIKEPINKKQKI